MAVQYSGCSPKPSPFPPCSNFGSENLPDTGKYSNHTNRLLPLTAWNSHLKVIPHFKGTLRRHFSKVLYLKFIWNRHPSHIPPRCLSAHHRGIPAGPCGITLFVDAFASQSLRKMWLIEGKGRALDCLYCTEWPYGANTTPFKKTARSF